MSIKLVDDKSYLILAELNLYITLIHFLSSERRLLEKSWDRRTAHPSSLAENMSSKSSGQCFVTSLLLYFKLAKALHKDIDFRIERGAVKNLKGHVIIADHFWLEIMGVKNSTLIIDLTLDQHESIDLPIILATKSNIKKQLSVQYIRKNNYIFYDFLDIKREARDRYKILLQNRKKILQWNN